MKMREERTDDIMSARAWTELFAVKEPDVPMPHSARILTSLVCEECGESVMESRTRRLEGRTMCIPCFQNQG